MIRLSKTELVCAVGAQLARRVAKYCAFGDMTAASIAREMKLPLLEAKSALAAMADGGYLEQRTLTDGDDGLLTQYSTTISGERSLERRSANPSAGRRQMSS